MMIKRIPGGFDYQLLCDKCNCWANPPGAYLGLDRKAQEKGWYKIKYRVNGVHKELDVCPRCAKKHINI